MTEDLERAIAQLVDRQQIADVILTAGRAGDRADLELLKGCYHPDAYEDHGYFRGNAWEFAEQALALQVQRYMSANHYLSAPLIQLDGDRAYAETYVQAVMIGEGDGGRHTLVFAGRYLDAFERRDGRWRIAQRITVSDYATTEQLGGPQWPWGDEPVFVVGTQGKTDPAYLLTAPERLREARRG
jgi:hypothetical protein